MTRLIGYDGGMNLQFSLKRLFASVTLVAIGTGLLVFLDRMMYRKSAVATLGQYASIATPLAFVCSIGAAYRMGAATAVLLKNYKIAMLIMFLTMVAMGLWYQSPRE